MLLATIKQWQVLVLMCLVFTLVSCTADTGEQATPEVQTQAKTPQAAKKKVLYVNAYDLDMDWAANTLAGALEVFQIKVGAGHALDDSESPVSFKLFNMKTKKNNSQAQKEQAALEAKALIETWQPDVVICADDNASKYLIVPYFKNSPIPFVFCGVNWDASEYGFPCSNVTGMLEVFPIREALDILGPYARGKRVGFLSHDTLSERKNAEHIKTLFELDLIEKYVTDLAGFEEAYKAMQSQSDILLIIEVGTLKGFDEDKYFQITSTHLSIPTVSFTHNQKRMRNYLLVCKRVPQEQGEWAAKAALEILAGKAPKDLPMTTNKKAAIRLNTDFANKLGIKFPMELIQRASFVNEEVGN